MSDLSFILFRFRCLAFKVKMAATKYIPSVIDGLNNSLLPTNDVVPDWTDKEHSTGTSIMAVEFNGGVVIGADSRTTAGSYVANRIANKLSRVTDKIYCCRSGSAADTQAVTAVVSYRLNIHKMEMGEEAKVKTAAAVFQEMCYNYRDQLMAGIIVAGWDEELGGQVYSIPLGGMRVRQPFAVGGSGSTYIWGHVDKTFKEKMSKDECIKFVSEALALAMMRDGSSGGVVRLAVITKDGVERQTFLNDKLPRFYEG